MNLQFHFFPFRWEDPNSQVVLDTGRVRMEAGKLYLTNAQPTDSGNYTCMAQNMAGTKNSILWIVVSGRPTSLDVVEKW